MHTVSLFVFVGWVEGAGSRMSLECTGSQVLGLWESAGCLSRCFCLCHYKRVSIPVTATDKRMGLPDPPLARGSDTSWTSHTGLENRTPDSFPEDLHGDLFIHL